MGNSHRRCGFIKILKLALEVLSYNCFFFFLSFNCKRFIKMILKDRLYFGTVLIQKFLFNLYNIHFFNEHLS